MLIIVHHLILTIAKITLILGDCPTYGINGSFGSPEKKFNINLTEANTKFCLSLHYNADNICLLMERKSLILNLTIKTTINPSQLSFVLEVYLMDLIM